MANENQDATKTAVPGPTLNSGMLGGNSFVIGTTGTQFSGLCACAYCGQYYSTLYGHVCSATQPLGLYPPPKSHTYVPSVPAMETRPGDKRPAVRTRIHEKAKCPACLGGREHFTMKYCTNEHPAGTDFGGRQHLHITCVCGCNFDLLAANAEENDDLETDL